jgi:hypothetical protein
MLTKDRFYCGKKVAYVYRASKEIRGTKIRFVMHTAHKYSRANVPLMNIY